ncbi:unnamed protein product [Closterium sp. NIES-53]
MTGELMAVKQIKMTSAGDEKAMHIAALEQEIVLYRQMRHRHIVAYIDMEKDDSDGSLYIFLEFISGGSIHSMLDKFGKFSESLVRVYTRQLLLGLEYLHGCKIIHRDIKGGNVLVDRDGVIKLADFGASKYLHGCKIIHRDIKGGNVLVDRDGVIKLADFGASKGGRSAHGKGLEVGRVGWDGLLLLVLLLGLEYLHGCKIIHRDIKGGNVLVDRDGVIKLADFGASKVGVEGMYARGLEESGQGVHEGTVGEGCKSIRGSVFWMAPEVIKGEGYGRRADIWSLGCTVIEMLTGSHPWPNMDNTWSAIFHIAKTTTGPPIPEECSDEGRDFLVACFKLDPAERPSATDGRDFLVACFKIDPAECPSATEVSGCVCVVW